MIRPSTKAAPQFLLDTNILSDLIRHPQGRIMQRIADIGEAEICTSIVVAAELRYGAARKGSARLSAQVAAVLAAMQVLALEPPADRAYGELRAQLEREGQLIGGNDLLIAAQAITLGLTLVTDNEREFRRVAGLTVDNWLRS